MYAQIHFKALKQQCDDSFNADQHEYIYVRNIKRENDILKIIDKFPLNKLFRIYQVEMNGKTYEVKTYINRINIKHFHKSFLKMINKNPSNTTIFTLLDRI